MLAGVIVVAVVTVILLIRGGNGDAAPDQATLEQLRGRVYDEAPELEREGIFVSMASIETRDGRRCVEVGLLNPTAPNRAWLADRYGPNVCVSREPFGNYAHTEKACPGSGPEVAVPDVTGLSLDAARRRLRAVGLTLNCNSDFNAAPSRFSANHALIVERVCDTYMRKGGMVILQLRGVLPGGFAYTGIGDRCAP